jgi:hypothetical protein
MLPKLTRAPPAQLLPAPTLQEARQRRRKARMGNKTKHKTKNHMKVAMERRMEGRMRQAMTGTESLTSQMVPPRMDHLALKDRPTRKQTRTRRRRREVGKAATTNRNKMVLSVL